VTGPLTPAGATLLTGCAAGYAAGVLLGYRVLIAIAIGGLVLLLAAGAIVLIRPRAELARTVQPDRVTVGEPTWGRLVVRNQGRWPAPGFVVVDQVGGDPVDLAVPMTAGGGMRTLRYPIPTRRRGRLRLGPLTVERRDPLGLFRRAQQLGSGLTLWVHPVLHPARPLPVGSVPDFEGRRAELAHGGTMTFSSLREYEPGDDPRRIHWKTTARTGQLMVREQVDTTEPTTTVVLDTRPAALTDIGFEHAVEVAASVAQAAIHAGRPARVLIPGEDAARLAADGAVSLLDRLAAAEQGDDDPVLLLSSIERAPAGGALVVITGAREPTLVAKLGEQRRRFSPVVVVTLLGAADEPMPARRRPGLAILTAVTGAEAVGAWNRMVLGEAG
jgi:uncharacterized protein (DUF58 family)